jgi:hypothetical protein
MGGRAGEFRPKTSRTRTENGRHGEGGSGQTRGGNQVTFYNCYNHYDNNEQFIE